MCDARDNRDDDLVLLNKARELHFYGRSVRPNETDQNQIVGRAFARQHEVLVARATAKVKNAFPVADGAGE